MKNKAKKFMQFGEFDLILDQIIEFTDMDKHSIWQYKTRIVTEL